MPLEIKELQINVSVEAANAKAEQQSAAAPAAGANSPQDQMSECIEQVMNTIQQQKER